VGNRWRGFFMRLPCAALDTVPALYNSLHHFPHLLESPMSRSRCTLAVILAASLVASAADPIKFDLSLFKIEPAKKGTEDLVKYDNDTLNFYANGTATAKLTVPNEGDYVIVVDASCQAALKENAKFTLKVGDKAIKENFELTGEAQKEYKFDAKLAKGETTLSITYTNDVYKENEYDRNLFVHAVRVEKK
jgi:Ca-dependent carbohydrate-binding module xylan-binding